MSASPQFTKRENEIIELLVLGKSNKEIASALGIREGTVESHLTKIFAKLGVSSRVEAILSLQNLGDVSPRRDFLRFYRIPIFTGVLVFVIFVIALVYFNTKKPWKYERECEYPNNSTAGQMVHRSRASKKMVHGQFGTTESEPWTAKAGEVIYTNINIPPADHLLLELRYSKFSPSSAQVLIFLDEEDNPRASIQPVDQGDWNRFEWTIPIDLGPIEGGLHTLKLYTKGQEFGVVDLDKFVLSQGEP